ncbi:MAG: molybdopterin oxidoreductase family protein, partial [Verrucomicrobiota bacterium]
TSDVIVLVGSNLCIAHPIMWERVMMNPHDPAIVVIDPRRTETAMAATDHLALQPKSDLALFYGIARILIENGWVDEDYVGQHTRNFQKFSRHVQDYTLERVSATTGLTQQQLTAFAQMIHEGRRVSFWWTMGINQSYEGVRAAQAIINIALMTGNIGRSGTGANSITGQCNAMGSRLFSNTTNLLGGHDFETAKHRRKVARILDIDEALIPRCNSLPYHRILEKIGQGKIKGLWMIATNTAHSWIHQRHFRDVADQLDFFVVQDMYHSTESAQMADLVLPAAGWGEKEGTFINSERRIGLVKKVARAPGRALADFHIFKLIAHAWGCGDLFQAWESPEDVFQILKKLSAGQPCDITGIDDYEMLDRAGGIQWPFPEGAELVEHERRLFEDGRFYHPDGRARFLFDAPGSMADPLSDEYPLVLLTGRGSSAQWHTQTRTGKSAVLGKLSPGSVYVEISPRDARRLRITMNREVFVESRRGRIRAQAYITPTVQEGQVFMPMHFDGVNDLTDSSFDPWS